MQQFKKTNSVLCVTQNHKITIIKSLCTGAATSHSWNFLLQQKNKGKLVKICMQVTKAKTRNFQNRD